MDSDHLKRVSSNLTKLAVLLLAVGVTMVYGTWVGPLKVANGSFPWLWKIGSILILYASIKCFAITKYLSSKT